MPVIQLDYIKKTVIIKEIESLFVKITGLDLHIIDLENTPSSFPCSLKGRIRRLCGATLLTECNRIDEGILKKLIDSKSIQVFKCPAGFTKMIVPMLLKGEVLGVLFAGENNCSRLDKDRLQSVSKLLYQMINYIIESESGSLKYFKTSSMTHQQEMLHRVIKYLQANYHKTEISLKDVARDNGVSYHYLSHLFKKELNTSFVKYRMNFKMEMAAKLLKNLRQTVSEISYMCGFNDPAYFSKVFKTSYGCSPGEFRRSMPAKNGNGSRNKKLNGNGKNNIAKNYNKKTNVCIDRIPVY